MIRRSLIVVIASLAFVPHATSAAVAPLPASLHEAIERGDADAVAPLRDRLASLSLPPASATNADLNLAVESVEYAAAYRLDEAGVVLFRLMGHPRLSTEQRSRLLRASADYRSPASEQFQRAMLADPRTIDPTDRVALLGALAERGDAAAIDALLAWTVAELVERSRRLTSSGPPLATVSFLACPAFTRRLAATPPPDGLTETQWAFWQQGVLLVHRPAGELLDEVERTTSEIFVTRAMSMLARIGTPEDARRLSTLKFGTDDAIARRANTQQYYAAMRAKTIAAIRSRCWRDATTRPTTEGAT